MPDISMCPSQDCPVRGGCYRNEASGTVPNDRRQSYIGFTWRQPLGLLGEVECDGFWEVPSRPALIPPAGRAALQKEEEGRG